MTEETEAPKTELQMLKARAKLMNITFSNNITVEKLKAKIEAKLADEPDADDADEDTDGEELFDAPTETPPALLTTAEAAPAPVQEPTPIVAPASAPTPAHDPFADVELIEDKPAVATAPRRLTRTQLDQEIRTKIYNDEMKLIRIRVTNMDPKKKELMGEFFTVANEYLGTVRKFVPYGDATDNGYHVPKCIYDQMQERKFLQIRQTKDRRTGTPHQETTWVREFALEVLPQLTQDDLDKLANAQAAAGSIDQGLHQ